MIITKKHFAKNEEIKKVDLMNSAREIIKDKDIDMRTNITSVATSVPSPTISASQGNIHNGTGSSATLYEQQKYFEQQLLQLKQHQEMQQQLLLQQFQQQQKQMKEQHEKQLQARIREYLEAQSKYEEEEKERTVKEKEKLEALKRKEKHEHSAIASSEVKQRLQEFVLNKKQREAKQAAAAAAAAITSNGQTSTNLTNNYTAKSSLLSVNMIWNPLLGKYEEDLMPLRKTASEPNLKVRSALKQKVIERRSSPLLKSKLAKLRFRPPSSLSTRLSFIHQHSLYGSITEGPASAPVSAISSMESSTPPNSKTESISGSSPATNGPQGIIAGLGSSQEGAVIQEDGNGAESGSPFSILTQSGDLQLYSSPSLPNISLGRPHISTTTASSSGTSILSDNGRNESQARTSVSRLISGSMLGSTQFPSILAFCPSLPVIQGEFSPPTSPNQCNQQIKILDQEANLSSLDQNLSSSYHPNYLVSSIGDNQTAHIRFHGGKTIHRPLGRTQSAPLPLGHPMLQSPSSSSSATSHQEHQRNLLKQHIRQTVLTRASSKQQLQSHSFEEETEAALAQEMKESSVSNIPSRKQRIKRQYSHEAPPTPEEHPNNLDENSLADLKGFKSREATPESESKSDLIKQSREREAFLAHQRGLISPRITIPINDPALYQQLLYQQQQQHQQIILIQSNQNTESHQPSLSLLPEGSHYSYYHTTRPLSRASSSPLVTLLPSSSLSSQEKSSSLSPPVSNWKFTTGLAYDNLMLKHQCICGDNSHHPEHNGRVQSIWARLQEIGLAARCEKIRSRKATLEEIQSCHSEAYTLLFGTSPINRQKLNSSKLADLPIKSFVMLPCGGIGVDSDTTWNELHTASAARMAAGCVIELAFKTITGEIANGLAIVRPPGHHAEQQQAMGFCFFNSCAIAAMQLRKKFGLDKILIVDWDVHHGNGIQQIFYDSRHVLYISIHRHDDGNFFPGTGDPNEIGIDEGLGFNVNIAWSGGIHPHTKGDAEYLAAFRSIVLPIARSYNPDIVLVASGFDAAAGHPPPLGGYQVSPACFGWMTKQLMSLAKGKVVLALEGGYDLPSICDCSQECVMALLGDETTPIKEEELKRRPNRGAVDTLKRVMSIHAAHWPIVKRSAHLIDCSHSEAQEKEKEEYEAVSALASLTMKHINSPTSSHPSNEEPMDQDIDK